MTTQFFTLFLFLCVFAVRCDAAETDTAIHGTLISAFGNRNGLVVVTDSMGTFKDASGQIRHQTPFQKLLKYDDHTVCAVAGLLNLPVPDVPNLNSAMLGIISRYRDQVKTQGIHESMGSALKGISTLVQFYLQSLAEINADTGRTVDASQYYLEMLMVGYDDLDGLAKIGKLVIKVEANRQDSGTVKWKASEVQNQVTPVQKILIFALKGMTGTARAILKNPELHTDYAILQAYAAARKSDDGASFTLAQMEELQRGMVNLTADVHKEVGGPKQVAVLKDGVISSFDQPSLPEPERPFGLVIHRRGDLQVGSPVGSILIRGKVVNFYDSMHFYGRSEPLDEPLTLDGNVFVNCVFENMSVLYDGGPVYLDGTNRAINANILEGPNWARRPTTLKSLTAIFRE